MCLKLGDRTLTCTLLLTMMLTDSCPFPSHIIRMGLWQTLKPNPVMSLGVIYYNNHLTPSHVLQPAIQLE